MIRITLILCLLNFPALIVYPACSASTTAEWQWSVPVPETNGCAYLWIPPSCKQVRGLIVTDANMLEQAATEDPIIRKAAAKANLGIVYFRPKTFMWFKYLEGAGEILERTLTDLARESGYSEIELAPLMPLGHSASTPFASYVAYWKPERTIAAIILKGAIFPAPDFDKDADAREVPAFAIVGEYYEWPMGDKSRLARWSRDRDEAQKRRSQEHRELMTFFTDVSRGHFDWTEDLAHITALYIKKAAKYRLPEKALPDGPVTLNKIDPQSGWLFDSDTVLAEHVPPAPYAKYAGDRAKAFWAFDQEMAKAIDRYGADQKTKAHQMVTFTQAGKAVDGAAIGYADLRYQPDVNDAMTIRFTGAYLDETPSSLSNQPALSGHSSAPLHFLCLGGPVVQTGPDTFRLRFNRFYPSAPTVLQPLVTSPGDKKYRMAFQPGKMDLPANREGTTQTLEFEKIPNQELGEKSIALRARSSAGLPVEFFVKVGPAEVEGNRLAFTKIPPRSKFPIKVTVAAWQYGRFREPKINTAPNIEQTFLIVHPQGSRRDRIPPSGSPASR